MAWTVELTSRAERQLAKLDTATARRIVDFLRHRVTGDGHPRRTGKALSGPLGEFWRYRVGDYRILCEIKDAKLIVLVVEIGHRRDVYR